MGSELVIYTDESDKSGRYFSNFYGGVLVNSKELEGVTQELQIVKTKQNLHREIKWQKVTTPYLGKYMEVVDAFFDFIHANRAKIRIMFTNNQYVPVGLSREQKKSEYLLLYYQFIKNSFGLQYCSSEHETPVRIRLNLDQMPVNREEAARFKAYLVSLNNNPQLRRAKIHFDVEQIAEVSSHNHVLLQCLDIVLGAMAFRLNNKHLEKLEGTNRRGKKTIAKEKLYKLINKRIREIYPGFNIGESTSIQGEISNRWFQPYRHWKFIPRNHRRDLTRAKK